MGDAKRKPLTDEQRERRNAYYKAWREANQEKSKAYHARYREVCPERKKARDKVYRQANKLKSKAHKRKHELKKKYGLSLEQYGLLLARCNGRCPICKSPFSDSILDMKPVVDHCHKTGRVRGVLCRACNRSLSELLSCPKLLRAAARYLERGQNDAESEAADSGCDREASPESGD
jgi:hypothetical protein